MQRTTISDTDRRVASVAHRQGGVIGYHQLVAAGLRRSTIAARARRGRYVRLVRGVYSIGTRSLSRRGELFAVLLAAGDDARLAGRTAIELRGVTVPGRPRIAVLVSRRWHGLPGVRVHESGTLHRSERARVDGMPTTTVARALLDVATDLAADQLGKLIHELDYRRQLVPRQVDAVLARNPRHPGRAALAEAMRRRAAGEAGTWSEFERRGHALLARADRERALRNTCVPVEHGEPIRVDAYYASVRLCIEFDPDHHLRPRTRRGDADRDVLLAASAYPRLRFTAHDVEHRPDHVIDVVRSTLAELRRRAVQHASTK